jgi:hypothetical protein
VTGALLRLDHDDSGGEARDQSVAVRETAARLPSERHFGDRRACRQDALLLRT